MTAERVCIIGGGVAGVGAWWTLSQPDSPAHGAQVTILHGDSRLGGHACTVEVEHDGATVKVDTGVQFYLPIIYRNIDAILQRPEFAGVRTADYPELKVGCGLPRTAAGDPQSWGNFPEYGATDAAKPPGSQFAMFSPEAWADASRFQDSVDLAPIEHRLGMTIEDYFTQHGDQYHDAAALCTGFLYPYLSIINGYGASLASQVTFADLLPLFGSLGSGSPWPGLARMTGPCHGYTRFVDGAQSFVDAMAASAQANQPSAQVSLDSQVSAVYPDATDPSTVHVEWTDGSGTPHSEVFDRVVVTTDMIEASCMLAAGPGTAWADVYQQYLCPIAEQLVPGYCVVHTDPSVLSPDLTNGEETLQFTAAYSADPSKPGGYDMFTTYTTYLQGNVHDDPGADGLYLTMYGYWPEGAAKGPRTCPHDSCTCPPVTRTPCKFPAADTILFEEYWTHGMWLPQFMMKEKQQLHLAQGPGNVHYEGQSPYPIYFAGNNTTADSFEHAFLSGAIIADYAFGAPLPVRDNFTAFAMYWLFKQEFMFPPPAEGAGRLHAIERGLHDL